MSTLFLDTETTGLDPATGAELVEVALVDDDGAILLHTLVNPGHPIPAALTEIHGITDAMVATAPTANDVRQKVLQLVAGHHLVIYNAPFDAAFFPGINGQANAIQCCLRRFADEWPDRTWSDERGGWKRQKLATAAAHVGHDWEGAGAHRALADALACRSVWHWLKVKG
jgi:DNA polymerase-3 subunit epsilon